jgi:hypothetical protein
MATVTVDASSLASNVDDPNVVIVDVKGIYLIELDVLKMLGRLA